MYIRYRCPNRVRGGALTYLPPFPSKKRLLLGEDIRGKIGQFSLRFLSVLMSWCSSWQCSEVP